MQSPVQETWPSVCDVLYVFDLQTCSLCILALGKSKHWWDHLHLWSEWLHKYTIWGIKGPAQVKADWQQHCLVRLHFILRSPQWPQALWPWGQCQSLRMLIKWDKPAPLDTSGLAVLREVLCGPGLSFLYNTAYLFLCFLFYFFLYNIDKLEETFRMVLSWRI